MADRIVMDPAAAIDGREALDITPWMTPDGADYGDAAMEAYRAQLQLGESVIDYRLPNRQMNIPLIPMDRGGTSFATFRSLLQAKAALWQREGGALGRYNPQGTAFAAVVAAGLTLGGDWLQSQKSADTQAALALEALPGWEEEEVELKIHEEKTAAELVFTETKIRGDMPAAVRVEVSDKQGADQKALIWSFRSRRYSSLDRARVAYEAEELQALGEASKGALSGASNGTAISHTALPGVWTPVVGTNFGGTGYLAHEGNYRVFARLRSPDGTAVSARLVWDVGDLVNPTENPAFTFSGGSAFYIADLGEVRLNPAPLGTHRWQGQIQGIGSAGGEDINVDKVWVVNTDEGMGILTAPPQASATYETVKAWDNFNATSSGTITGKVAPLGGTWTGGGDAVGFTVDTSNKWITRAEKSDADLNTGYYARLGAGTAAKVDARLDVYLEPVAAGSTAVRRGVFVRYTDTSNWLMACYEQPNQFEYIVRLYKRVAGTVTLILNTTRYITTSGWRTIRLTADAAGLATIYEGPQGASLANVGSTTDTALATSGSLESGGYGGYDAYTGSGSITRKFDNFYVTAPTTVQPTADAVVFASQKLQVMSEGMFRLDMGGSAYGPVSRITGDLPRIPPTQEGRTTEVFIKASRGDMDELPDSAIDDIAAKVFYKPTWLTFPGT